MSCFDMFVISMNRLNNIGLLAIVALTITCGRSQNPSDTITKPDSTSFADPHSDYVGKLSGTWYRNLLGARATLVLEPISPDRVSFSITALSGSHTGEIDGFLTVDGLRASYSTQTEQFGNCTLLFDGSVEGSIRIEQEGCQDYGGVGVVFLGLYDRKWSPDETLALAMLEERYGVDATREIHFRAGTDFDILASTLHLENPIGSGDEFSDVTEYYLRGMQGLNSSCIAVNSQTGEVWIAYVRDRNLLYTGELDRAPVGFVDWTTKTAESHGLTITRKPDSI